MSAKYESKNEEDKAILLRLNAVQKILNDWQPRPGCNII